MLIILILCIHCALLISVVLSSDIYTTLEQANNDDYHWSSIAASEDGMFLAGTIANYGIAIAHDYGFAIGGWRYGYDWILTDAPAQNWKSIVMTGKAEVLCAAVNGEGIYTSYDRGSHWNKTSAVFASWNALSISETGVLVFAVQNQINGSVFISSNSGSQWIMSRISASGPWCSISCSSSGRFAAVVACNGGLYMSVDYGLTFASTKAGSVHWTTVTMDGSGSQIAGAVSGGRIHVSHDQGLTWSIAAGPVANWKAIVSSKSGAYMYAVVYEGGMFYSRNNGSNWSLSKSPSARWSAITTSAGGDVIAATEYGGHVYANHIDLVLYIPTIIAVALFSVLVLYGLYRCYRQYRKQRRQGYIELTTINSYNPFSALFAATEVDIEAPTRG